MKKDEKYITNFNIKSRQLTKVEELAISKHIKNYKLKNEKSTKDKSTF
jgi:hypothetical protein